VKKIEDSKLNILYNKMKIELDNKNKPIEVELVKKIEKK